MTVADVSLVPSAASRRGFLIGLYVEHLEEASFLYEQRRDTLLDDPELAWADLDDYEERLEAHLDGLVLGEDLALAVCREQVAEGDVGELHAAVCVFCRHERKDLLEEVLDSLDAGDEERVLAVRDALRDELPPAWEADVAEMLGHRDAWRQRLAAHVIGYRRLDAAGVLMASLPDAEPDSLSELVWALGRLRARQARQTLCQSHIRHDDEPVREAAALALLRLGEPAALQWLREQEPRPPWAYRLLGIAGAQTDRELILDALRRQPTRDVVLALGLLGHPTDVDALLGHVSASDVAEAAALALHLITGAELVEEAFVPEEVDEDELFEDELEAYRRGELPTRPDGEPYGTTVVRLAQDADTWHAWWNEHESVFQRGVRYRSGQPFTPATLIDNLRSEYLPRHVRQLAYEELVVRYGFEAHFETEYWVRHQRPAITELEAQVRDRGRVLREGRWYFDGQPQHRPR